MKYEAWVIADRLRREVGLPYRLDEAPALNRLIRLTAEAAAAIADEMGHQDAAQRIREHFGEA